MHSFPLRLFGDKGTSSPGQRRAVPCSPGQLKCHGLAGQETLQRGAKRKRKSRLLRGGGSVRPCPPMPSRCPVFPAGICFQILLLAAWGPSWPVLVGSCLYRRSPRSLSPRPSFCPLGPLRAKALRLSILTRPRTALATAAEERGREQGVRVPPGTSPPRDRPHQHMRVRHVPGIFLLVACPLLASRWWLCPGSFPQSTASHLTFGSDPSPSSGPVPHWLLPDQALTCPGACTCPGLKAPSSLSPAPSWPPSSGDQAGIQLTVKEGNVRLTHPGTPAGHRRL